MELGSLAGHVVLTSGLILTGSGMSRAKKHEFALGLDPSAAAKTDLTIAATSGKTLSPAQAEFNKRMKALEKARVAHEREQARLDAELRKCITEWMPLVEKKNQTELELVLAAVAARQSMKLTPKRAKWLGDLISGKASDLLADPVGLSEGELDHLEAIIKEFGPSQLDQERREMEREEFEEMREMMEEMARRAGVELDLSDLDLHGDRDEFERQFEERLNAAEAEFAKIDLDAVFGANPKPKRKPTKAALERERLKQEVEEAKNRDFKTLYKQLAKVLHPDLETDPVLKAHKEAWMKRLTTARAKGDLRDMLAIEMEWLGEESGNLTKASDDKLRVYAMVLKEQLAELKEQTYKLTYEPQYQPLLRFIRYAGVRCDAAAIKRELADETARLQEMLDVLRAGGADARTMLHQWADSHARMSSRR